MSDEYPTARYATPRDLRAAYPLTPSDVAQQQAAALLFGQAGPAPQHPLFGNAARAKPARVIKLKRQRDDAERLSSTLRLHNSTRSLARQLAERGSESPRRSVDQRRGESIYARPVQ